MTTHVTAQDADDGSSETQTITNNYVLVRDGSAYIANVQMHRLKDGSTTHVITVKGCKQ